MGLYIAATLGLAVIGTFLVHDQHPVFGCLSGLLAAVALFCASTVEIKIIKE